MIYDKSRYPFRTFTESELAELTATSERTGIPVETLEDAVRGIPSTIAPGYPCGPWFGEFCIDDTPADATKLDGPMTVNPPGLIPCNDPCMSVDVDSVPRASWKLARAVAGYLRARIFHADECRIR